MVERYWLGIHKVAATAESASNLAANEPPVIVKQPISYDFSDVDCGGAGNPLRSPVLDPLEKAAHAPEPDLSYSWIGLDLQAKPDTASPAAKDSSATA